MSFPRPPEAGPRLPAGGQAPTAEMRESSLIPACAGMTDEIVDGTPSNV